MSPLQADTFALLDGEYKVNRFYTVSQKLATFSFFKTTLS